MGKRGGQCRYRGIWKIRGHPASLEGGVVRPFVHMEGASCGGGSPEEPKGRNPFVVASVYSPAHPGKREELWEDLRQLHGAFPETMMLIGGDFNVTLRANDRPNGGGGRDPGSAQLRELIDSLSLAEMGPLDRRLTWSEKSSKSRLDRFLCSVEMLAAYPLAEVSALPRPLSDHTPITWSAKAGDARPTYFKMDRSWLRDEKLKADISEWWRSRLTFGQTADQLVTKLKDLRHHLFDLCRQIRVSRTQARDAALMRVRLLDAAEDLRPLSAEEDRERKVCQCKVAEVDYQIEMDWRQRSRLLCLAAEDANTRFFHQTANGRRRQNCIYRLQIGGRTLSDQSSIGQAIGGNSTAEAPLISGDGWPLGRRSYCPSSSRS